MANKTIEHRALQPLKNRFSDVKFFAGEFRAQVTVVVPRERIVEVAKFLHDDATLRYDMLADLNGVPGRFQVVSAPQDDLTVIVDYAHTDDALRNLLETARPLYSDDLLSVAHAGAALTREDVEEFVSALVERGWLVKSR